MNLLQETLDILAEHDKSPEDVLWVGCRNGQKYYSGYWKIFERLADFEYDNGYGGNEIEISLKVVGADWWLERGEYDGSEWWEFKTLPVKPNVTEPLEVGVILRSFGW